MEIREIINSTDRYNLHSHTPYCDGHAPLHDMTEGALACGMLHYGISPHSPIPVESPCNMAAEAVRPFIEETSHLKEEYEGSLNILTGMEIDFLSKEWGPHIDYFQKLPLDYRIGSVHFVVNQDGIPIDCDGSAARFAVNLKEGFRGDLHYVVERYFEQLLTMMESGGFDILGHADKIASNASAIDQQIEGERWYEALIDDVARKASDSGLIVEINTKAYADKGRFFPSTIWWDRFIAAGAEFAVNSDAHWPDRIDSGRREAFEKLATLGLNQKGVEKR